VLGPALRVKAPPLFAYSTPSTDTVPEPPPNEAIDTVEPDADKAPPPTRPIVVKATAPTAAAPRLHIVDITAPFSEVLLD